jgi:two-component system sensor histidine kinase GlrK
MSVQPPITPVVSVSAASRGLLRYRPKSFLKLILLGFTLVALPLIGALIYAAVSIDRLAVQSRQAVYQSVQIAHGSRVLLDEITTMERGVRQALILGDATLLEGFFQAHARFVSQLNKLAALSLRRDQATALVQLRAAETPIYQQVLSARDSPDSLQPVVNDFVPLLVQARGFAQGGYTLIEQEVSAMQDRASRTRSIVLWLVLALAPFTLLLALLFSVLISRPIRVIDEAIRRMGQGELDRPVSVTGPQDLRYLGERLDWMRLRLLEVEAQKERFLQHVSHELKTPLTAMREGADLLASGVVGELSDKQKSVANILYGNSLQLQKRIEDLLNYSAIQAQPTALNPHQVALQPLLDLVLQSHQLAVLNQRLQVIQHCPEVHVYADEQKLCIILDNLLSNAVKFSPPGGVIRIDARVQDKTLVLDVRDAGAGVDAADRDKVFEPFYQGRQAPQSHVKGTGLGLSIAREYARAHGGDIILVETDRAGAHFRLHLPLQLTQQSHA